MKSFNKKRSKKNMFKKNRSIIKKRDVIKTKDEFDRVIIGNGNKYSNVFAKDKNGDQIGIYAIIYNKDFVAQDVLFEGRLYDASKEGTLEYFFNTLPVINGYAVEIDAYPTFRDWVEFPITDVEIYSDDEEHKVCERLIENDMYSIIDPKDEDAYECIKYFNEISKGFQSKKR